MREVDVAPTQAGEILRETWTASSVAIRPQEGWGASPGSGDIEEGGQKVKKGEV